MDAQIKTARKKLTIFFSDVCDFTSITESLEAEDLSYVLNSYLNRMAEIVLKYGGTLDKFIGDAVMVFFGDPETKGTKEDALACVNMAIEMRESLPALRNTWKNEGIDCPLHIRMGMTTGYVTVGNFGSEARMDYTIVGSPVNLAARLP